MNQVDQNINKDMIESDLIDVESLDYSDDQTWLYTLPNDSGNKVDIVDLSCDWPIDEDDEYQQLEKKLNSILDNILKNDVALPDKHTFDSRTYVRPKKRVQRPSIQSIIEVSSNNPSPTHSLNPSANKYLTYNKYSMPLGPISPMLRLKTFNVDTNSDNSHVVKEYAMKRRSLVQDDDPQLEDLDVTLAFDGSDRLTSENGPAPSRPINIDLSQPAHNLHNTFNKGLTNMMNERSSLNMYQSGESLMRMSPPSLVSSILMESSGNFNAESLDSRKSISNTQRDSGIPQQGRESIDPMMTSMTLSILDEKDMSTSFLSQTTYPDNDSLIDSLPPSLVSSVNSSYILSNTPKPKDTSQDSNIFSSVTFTHLEQSEKLLSARPRCQLFNSITKRDSAIRNSESYTKSREEACQIDTTKILNENSEKKDSLKPLPKTNPNMAETITLHYSNSKFKSGNEEKENLNSTFEQDDAFYKDMGMQRTVDLGRNSLNVTLDKQELNEIIQARQKLSLARKALPSEPDKLPNQPDPSPTKTIQLPNQTITVPRQSMENASELLSRRKAMNGGFDRHEEPPARETPKRNATFKKVSPKTSAMDTTMVYVKTEDNQNIIDINSATLNLTSDRTLLHEEWGSQERAMVGSSESTDTGTFSSSSPPESVPDTITTNNQRPHIASTPLMALKKGAKSDLLNLHNTISPIYDMVDDKSYTVTKAPSPNNSMERTYDMHNTTVINSATMVKKSTAKRDILAGRVSPEKRSLGAPQTRSPPSRISPTNTGPQTGLAPPVTVPRKTGLPTSKFRQYSSHRELSRIPGSNPSGVPRASVGRPMVRRGVYASNPVLSPTTPSAPAPPVRRDSYTLAVDHAQLNAQQEKEEERAAPKTAMVAPPTLVRQGTETLRRERPQSQLVVPKDLRAGGGGLQAPTTHRNQYMLPPTTRPYSIAGVQQLRVSRPTSVPTQRPVPAPVVTSEPRPVSALPRPSRLPAPRRALRPPSVYSVAPAADIDHY